MRKGGGGGGEGERGGGRGELSWTCFKPVSPLVDKKMGGQFFT